MFIERFAAVIIPVPLARCLSVADIPPAPAATRKPDVSKHSSKLGPHVSKHVQGLLAEEVLACKRAGALFAVFLQRSEPPVHRRSHDQVIGLLAAGEGAAAWRGQRSACSVGAVLQRPSREGRLVGEARSNRQHRGQTSQECSEDQEFADTRVYRQLC